MNFHREILQLDPERETERIVERLRHDVFQTLQLKGGVLGVSGGVDSAVCLALAARRLGPDRLVAILLPEMESSPESAQLARLVCRQFDVTPHVEDVTGPLLGFDCYRRRDEVVREIFPEYDSTYQLKITLPPDLLEREMLNVFSLTIVSPEGNEQKKRLKPAQLRRIVAATNFKQRCRATMLYYHADVHNYAVVGTPPKNEHALGFFVKHGDGAMDVRPIVHLYKSQVYQLAEYLDVPAEIRRRPPTTDTYSADTTQEEFFFRLPHAMLDLLFYGWEHGIPAAAVASEIDLTPQQVQRAYNDFGRKTRTTEYLRTAPLGMEDAVIESPAAATACV